MKTLYLMRHADTNVRDVNIFDEERTLTQRGYADVNSVATRLKNKGIKIDLILSNCAMRGQETSLELAKVLNYQDKIHYHKELYLDSSERLKETLTFQEEHNDNLFVIGHNDQLKKLIYTLSGEKIEDMPTSSIIELSLDINTWDALETVKSNIECYLYANELEEALAS